MEAASSEKRMARVSPQETGMCSFTLAEFSGVKALRGWVQKVLKISNKQQSRRSCLNRAAEVPVKPLDARKAVMRPPGDSTALKPSRMYAIDAGKTGCRRYRDQPSKVRFTCSDIQAP